LRARIVRAGTKTASSYHAAQRRSSHRSRHVLRRRPAMPAQCRRCRSRRAHGVAALPPAREPADTDSCRGSVSAPDTRGRSRCRRTRALSSRPPPSRSPQTAGGQAIAARFSSASAFSYTGGTRGRLSSPAASGARVYAQRLRLQKSSGRRCRYAAALRCEFLPPTFSEQAAQPGNLSQVCRRQQLLAPTSRDAPVAGERAATAADIRRVRF